MWGQQGGPMLGGSQARNVNIDPNAASVEYFNSVGVDMSERKLASVHDGGALRDEHKPFPHDRACQDVVFAIAFFFTVVGTLGFGYLSSGPLLSDLDSTSSQSMQGDSIHLPHGNIIGMLIMVCSVVSLCASVLFVMLAHRAPSCVVWTSLVFGPVFMIAMGFMMMATGEMIGILGGGVMVFLGFCMLTCTFFCYKDLVPFMIQVTEAVADVIEDHPCMIMVGVFGSVLGFLWTVSASLAFAAIYYKNQDSIDMDNKATKYGVVFICGLLFVWGGGVASNICHVTYCGVFGRWYYGHSASSSESDSGTGASTLFPAFKAAMTTSLGSICFGSLLVAIIRALEMVARSMRQDSQESGNYVTCVIMCCIEMFISCIGDILEYFNDWAYVQCAVRGASYLEAATITYALMTCANMQYVISDLLLNSVVTMGTCLVACVTAIFGAGTGYAMSGSYAAGYGAGLGLLIGFISGSAALGIINSGVKTLLVSWADDPMPLRQTHPDISQAFEERLNMNMAKKLEQ